MLTAFVRDRQSFVIYSTILEVGQTSQVNAVYHASLHFPFSTAIFRWRCPAGKRFDEAYLECRDKKDVIECKVDPDQDDDYPYELIPFKPS